MGSFHDPQTRRLAWLTMTDIAAIPKEHALLVQPIASVEQHGPHLPCYTDSLIIEEVLSRAVSRIPTDVEVWTLPILAYGLSTEHLGYPGTISLASDTLIAVCRDVGRSVATSGFRKLVFVNGHGGQPYLLELVARDIRAETGLQVFPLSPYKLGLPQGIVKSTTEAQSLDISYGHGGEIETSTVLAVAPSAVRKDRLRAGSSRVQEIFAPLKYLSLEGSLPTAWLSRDVAPESGVLGDPTLASAESGEQVIEHLADGLAGALIEVASFEF